MPLTKIVAIIPARLGSTRFPGKVLADRTGRPLIRHVYEAVRRSAALTDVCIATDDETVSAAVARFGGRTIMTSPVHPNGSSRLAEAARTLGLDDRDIVVNVQGDEPELEPALIDAAVRALELSGAEVSTIGSPFGPGEDAANPNVVKVVRRADGLALYFSRSLIPFPRVAGPAAAAPLRHVGLYVYRAGFLQTYVNLPATPLEVTESLEQLRVLEHGYRIAVAVEHSTGQGIDTPEQYEAFVARWRGRNG
ncbi:MAG: 3-deoxy-manno-octulosonate cytidylyltransferase [Phycisphaerales bacterium]|nr:3-deoxy-manno-octulosonate cytidylyltransferase [Phycisphaerales bacterium]